MSTREMAYSIFSQLNEEQLEGFIAMFHGYFPKSAEDNEASEKEAQARRDAAFEALEKLRKPIPNLDEKAELNSWRDERFG